MIVGIPTEIKPDERRVALTPAGAAAFRSRNHCVLVQSGAGAGSGFTEARISASEKVFGPAALGPAGSETGASAAGGATAGGAGAA